MTTSPNLLFFAGSARTGSHNKRLAKLGADVADKLGFSSTFVDLADYPLPLYGGDLEAIDGQPENAKKLNELVRQHQGVFISCPEYNASITPLLKNTLDWLSRMRTDDPMPKTAFTNRIIALGAVSPGGMGGLRGLNAVREVLTLGLQAVVLPDQIAVPHAMKAFDDEGLTNKDLHGRFEQQIKRLAHAAGALEI